MISKNELKFIRSLKNKKYRSSEKRFLVEGEKNVFELMNSDFQIERILASKEFLNSHAKELSIFNSESISKDQLSSLSTLKSNERVIAVAIQKDYDEGHLKEFETLFALDGINDPGNLGTILRTLDWFGYDQVICSAETVEFYNPKVISASMGSFCRVKPIYTNLRDFVSTFKGSKTGAHMGGENISDWQPNVPSLIVMGSESHGISQAVSVHMDNFVSIPRIGGAESLNVGVATGILCSKLID